MVFFATFLSVAWAREPEMYVSSPEVFAEWMGGHVPDVSNLAPSEAFTTLRRAIVRRVKETSKAYLESVNFGPNKEEYPYFHWIPPYVGTLIPDGPAITWTNKCFRTNRASAKTNANGTISVTVTTGNHSGLLCNDFYLFATLQALALVEYDTKDTHTFVWNTTGITAAEKYDISTLGIRLFRFVDERAQARANLLATVELFVSEATKAVPPETAKVNLDFLAKYRGVTMKPRVIKDVPVDPSYIHSGDFFGVIRLDGLDPMLGWAMGSTTGHTTVALWIGGELYICESTTKDSYWPTNGIQKTPYNKWVEQAKEASYQVVHAPLKEEYRKKFNVTKAIQFFESVEGVDYGYFNMLWGWVDTIKDNYPCVPPDYTICLQWEHVPVLFGNAVKLLGPIVGNLLISQAFSQRVGTPLNSSLADSMMVAAKKGMDLRNIPTIVEQDSWLYNTTRFGQPAMAKSMVCCVFVCNIWKAAGIFDEINSDLNCAELTNWDDYSLTIFEESDVRPEACKTADPDNPICQLVGDYTLQLNDYHTKKIIPHIAEKCPSLTPKYERPSDC